MKQLTLRLPDELHQNLKELAEREHRSLHAQIIHIIYKYLDVIYTLESELEHLEDKKQS